MALALAAIVAAAAAVTGADALSAAPLAAFPKLAAFLDRARTDPASLATDLRESPVAQIGRPMQPSAAPLANKTFPIVVAHGMGDSCFNAGMKSIAKESGAHAGVCKLKTANLCTAE